MYIPGILSGTKCQTVLVAPLDWGLGHATRCIPVIRYLIDNGNRVILGGSGLSMEILKDEFPELERVELPAYNIHYSRKWPFLLTISGQLPKIFRTIGREKQLLEELIDQYEIDMVISDNRYGLFSKKIECHVITHQLMIKMPRHLEFMEGILYRWVKWRVDKFDKILIPDFDGAARSLSGDLSHKYPIPAKACFTGPLTRFIPGDDIKMEYDLTVILSGPEPQRTLLEEKILAQIQYLPGKKLLIRGNGKKLGHQFENLEILPVAGSSVLQKIIARSKLIISRSGYSSVMDLFSLSKRAILIPTPGQTEQEYLANYLMEKGWFYSQKQKDLDLKKAIAHSIYYLPESERAPV